MYNFIFYHVVNYAIYHLKVSFQNIFVSVILLHSINTDDWNRLLVTVISLLAFMVPLKFKNTPYQWRTQYFFSVTSCMPVMSVHTSILQKSCSFFIYIFFSNIHQIKPIYLFIYFIWNSNIGYWVLIRELMLEWRKKSFVNYI